jgi:hypothetical protein
MDRSSVYEEGTRYPGSGDGDTDWQTLLKHHDAAVSDFERVSTALRAALARYPLSAEFLDLIAVEERAREAVLHWRARMIKLWHDNIDDTIPVRALKSDHICDSDGPTEAFVDENGHEATAGIFPTCSQCGTLQMPGGDVTSASSTSV